MDENEKPSDKRLTPGERRQMYHLWLQGRTFAEIAKEFDTYRQKPRSVVLSFDPSFAAHRRHHHFRLLRALKRGHGRQ